MTNLIRWIAVWTWMISVPAMGTEIPKYKGDFQLSPHVMHPGTIKGVMTLLADEKGLNALELVLDQPIFGNDHYNSREFWAGSAGTGTQSLSIVYNLKGPTHKWYFVALTQSVDGSATYQGSIYKVNAAILDIQKLIQGGLTAVPGDWQMVGKVLLKEAQ